MDSKCTEFRKITLCHKCSFLIENKKFSSSFSLADKESLRVPVTGQGNRKDSQALTKFMHTENSFVIVTKRLSPLYLTT